MLKKLQILYPDIINIETTASNLLNRWRGKVYVELPYTNYEQWLKKFYIASSNYCLVFAKIPLLFAHTVVYNYIFYQSQIIIFPQSNYVLTVSGFFKKLPSEDFMELYELGKVYVNNSYKKIKD